MQLFNMRSKEWVFFRYQRSKEVVQRCHKGRAAQTARSEKMYEKEKGKNNCSNTAPWILEVFVAANPRLEVVLSSVDGPPSSSSSSASIFMGRGDQKLVGGRRVPAPGRSWKKKKMPWKVREPVDVDASGGGTLHR